MSSDPFRFDDALEKALANDPVPPLSAGFADRVIASTEGRAAPLPPSRRANGRWRSGRRLVLGIVAAGALGTAAAATGVLNELGIPVPSAGEVWSRITGEPAASTPATAVAPSPSATNSADTREPVSIEGPIDSPEELEEAFRRLDEVRAGRVDARRDRVDNRIDNAIERRRASGIEITPEQEERFRNRVDNFRERRDARTDDVLEERREGLRERIESGEELTREDFIDAQRGIDPDSPRGRRLERWRQLPPEERRERIRQWRERRQERLQRMEQAPIVEQPAESAETARPAETTPPQ